MGKYTVWVKNEMGCAGRTEFADTPEEARAAVQGVLDAGIETRLGLKDRLFTAGPYTIIGVETYEEGQKRSSAEEVEAAFKAKE